MTQFSKTAKRAAIDLVTTGLQSGSIKLVGAIDNAQASENAQADALYLSTLIKALAEQLTQPDDDSF